VKISLPGVAAGRSPALRASIRDTASRSVGRRLTQLRASCHGGPAVVAPACLPACPAVLLSTRSDPRHAPSTDPRHTSPPAAPRCLPASTRRARLNENRHDAIRYHHHHHHHQFITHECSMNNNKTHTKRYKKT